MRPILSDKISDPTQTVDWDVTVYDTPHTVVSNGMIYRPATTNSGFGSIDLLSASQSTMTTHFNNNTTPGITDSNGNEVNGRIPVMHDYWGTGAPIGVRSSNKVALRIKGYVQETQNAGLVALGRGNVRVFHEGTAIMSGQISERNPVFTSSLQSLTAGDEIEIFYWSVDQPWGGLSLRVFNSSHSALDSGSIDWEGMRESDILSSSFMDDNQSVSSIDLDHISSVEITINDQQVSLCDISIPAVASDASVGWHWDSSTKKLENVETSDEISIGDLVKVEGGVVGEKHPQFAGHVSDIYVQGDSVQIECLSYEKRLADQFSENYPDRISYASFGYTKQEGVSEPVWAIPAYDNWPYEHAIKDMLARAWIDSSLMNASKDMPNLGGSGTQSGEDLFTAKSLSGEHIKIQRQANYGNPDAEPDQAEDDQYLTSSKITQSLYNRINELIERIGYRFKTDAEGNFTLRPRNNALSIVDISDGTSVTNPAAIGGQYQEFTGTGWSYTSDPIVASRLDLVVGLGSGLGTIQVDITRAEDSFSDTFLIDTSNSEEVFYYDEELTVDLTNAAVFQLLEGEDYGTYTVEVTPSGGGASTEYRLDAIRVYEEDPSTPVSGLSLSDLYNVIEASGQSNFTEKINDAIVTGARTLEGTAPVRTIEQPQAEYITSRSTDVDSILNPNASNYYGRKISSFLSKNDVSSQNLADWLSRTLVAQYRSPEPDLRVQHTVVPVIEIGDPIYIQDTKFDTINNNVVYWVTGYSHSFEADSAITRLELTPFPEVPSFEPREEIDLSLYDNKPAINVDISYPSLSNGPTIQNPGNDLAQESTRVVSSGTIANDGSYYMSVDSGTVSPGTDLLHIPFDLDQDTFLLLNDYSEYTYYKNNPYNKFYEKNGTRLDLPFEMADGSAAYDVDGWGFEVGDNAEFSFHKIQDVYSGSSPFYDPYYSELNPAEVVTINFDALVSGYYRISVVDARGANPTTVAWLTNKGSEETTPEKHWQYLNAGPDKEFLWDGIDNIGEWNRTQTEEYSWRQRGNFDNVENPIIGKNFYAANDKSTSMTHISDETESGEVVYPVGNYAQFFVRIEYVNDATEETYVVESNNSDDLLNTSASTISERYIYYHLPDPNKATISIEDWDIVTGGDYDSSNPGSDWNSSPDENATIKDTKPVRVSIDVQKRKGSKFSDNSETNIKVSRSVQLSAIIKDITAVLYGESWNARSAGNRKKHIVCRRFDDSEHQIIFEDADFVPGNTIDDWVFYPSLFEKKFDGEEEEELRYLDYLQLNEVPSWNPQRRTGEERSRHLMAMMSYLFYLSVYTQDKSGRLVWAIDDTFVDKSKILNNTDTTEFPTDLDRHQRRTVYTRQWWDYDKLDNELSNFSVPSDHYGGYSDRFDYHSHGSLDLYPTTSPTTYHQGDVETIYTDQKSQDVYDGGRLTFDGENDDRLDRNLGNNSGGTALGSWTWETDGFLWIPNPTRDFHPFYRVPPMPLVGFWTTEDHRFWAEKYWYAITQVGKETEHDNYFSVVTDHLNFEDVPGLRPGFNVEDEYEGEEVPEGIIQYQRQDDIKHYENCRGGFTNSAGDSRDVINVVGGDPYYLNVKMYRYFGWEHDPGRYFDKQIFYYNDVWRKGWFFTTFRHTYNWESASYFPVDEHKFPLTGAIDADKTGSPVRPDGFDPGGYAGWKDDHPSSMQQGNWEYTGTCDSLHWRSDYTNETGQLEFDWDTPQAGGSCSIEDPTQEITHEREIPDYTANKNIFLQTILYDGVAENFDNKYAITRMPLAVGPRLPETRRVLLGLKLINNRRTSAV